tara:strand:- start:2147 stop:2401 length:255 start_codon:yes stop_codon:yes gene_type:complete
MNENYCQCAVDIANRKSATLSYSFVMVVGTPFTLKLLQKKPAEAKQIMGDLLEAYKATLKPGPTVKRIHVYAFFEEIHPINVHD